MRGKTKRQHYFTVTATNLPFATTEGLSTLRYTLTVVHILLQYSKKFLQYTVQAFATHNAVEKSALHYSQNRLTSKRTTTALRFFLIKILTKKNYFFEKTLDFCKQQA